MVQHISEEDAMNKVNKTNRLFIRLSDVELQQIRRASREAGLSMSSFARKCLLRERVTARLSEEYLAMRRDIAGLCNNVNQIAHSVNSKCRDPIPAAQEARLLAQRIYDLMKGEDHGRQ